MPNIVVNQYNHHMGALEDAQERMETWSKPVMVTGEIFHAKVLKATDHNGKLTTNSPIKMDSFSLLDVPRHKSIMIIKTQRYRPLNMDLWNSLLKTLQLNALTHGVTLGVAKGGMGLGYYILYCRRGRIARNAVRNQMCETTNDNNVAQHARGIDI